MSSRQEISRRSFLGTAAATAALAGVSTADSAETATPKRKPNVLYLFSDEHRWQSISNTELPQVQTPNIVAFGEQGLAFSHCISNYPVCSPYRGIFLTGRWPYQTGVIDNELRLSPDENTLAKVFKAAGYHTGYIGKWHLGGVRAEPYGFDHSLIWSETNTHWDKSKYHPANGEPVQPKGYNATLMTDQTLDYITAHKDEPFFLAVSWNPPHSNFLDPPEAKKALYAEGSLPRRPNTPNKPEDAPGGPEGWKNIDWKTYQGYHAHISAIDDELARVLKKLDELGLTDNTIVVYSSDHGSMQGSQGVGGKRQPFEESIRVPFFVRYPGVVKPGGKTDALFGTIDIAPTLCGLAGIEKPTTFEGRDYSPLIRGEAFEASKSQFIMHISKEHASGGDGHPAPLFRGLRTETLTYAELIAGGGLLFDLKSDPYQQKNLYDDPAYADKRKELHAELQEALKRAHDPLGTPAKA